MKTIHSLFLTVALLCARATSPLLATDAPPRWNVRVEVLMAAVPEDRGLALLPDLRDEAKAGAAVDRLLEMIKTKEATLTDYPLIVLSDRQKATSQSTLSRIMPVLPEKPAGAPVEGPLTLATENNNGGCLLEVEPTTSADGGFIQLNLSAGRRVFGAVPAESFNTNLLQIERPAATGDRTNTSLTCRNGQWVLLGSHKAADVEKSLEFFVVRATALPLAPGATVPAPATADTKKWNVHVETSMIGLREDKALALLPDLCDEGKIDAVCQQLDEMVRKQEATLTGHPSVNTLSGQAANYELTKDVVYPSQFVVSPTRAPIPGSTPATDGSIASLLYPTKFDRRHVGTSLSVEPVVLEDGQQISLSIMPERSEDLKSDFYEVAQPAAGLNTRVELPRIFTAKDTCGLVARNGQRLLLGVHKSGQNAGQLEFFIVQATATPAH